MYYFKKIWTQIYIYIHKTMNRNRTLSLGNSRTITVDNIFLTNNSGLTSIYDTFVSSETSFDLSNLTDNSITDIVLSNLWYSSTSDVRISFDADQTILDSTSSVFLRANNSTVLSCYETYVGLNVDLISNSDITATGNISCGTLNAINIDDYLTSDTLTNNDITELVIDSSVCWASTSNPRLTLASTSSSLDAPSNVKINVNSTEVIDVSSSEVTLNQNLSAPNVYTKTEVDDEITTNNSIYCGGFISSTGAINRSTGKVGFTVDKTATGKYTLTYDTSRSFSNSVVVATAVGDSSSPCQGWYLDS